jgi:hypothetical protein
MKKCSAKISRDKSGNLQARKIHDIAVTDGGDTHLSPADRDGVTFSTELAMRLLQ